MPDGSGTKYNNGAPILVTAPVNLYAQWTPDKIQAFVIYDSNGGSGMYLFDSTYTNTDYTIRDNTYIKDGFEFKGWNTAINGSGTSYMPGQVVQLTETLLIVYAQWEPVAPQSYKVTYYPTQGEGAIKEVTVAAGGSHTIADQGYKRVGFAPNGYNTQSDGLGTAYSIGDVITVNGNISLYAQWKPKFMVIYSPSGGDGLMKFEYVEDDGTHTVLDMGYTRFDYQFNGYNTIPDGSGTRYFPGDVITPTGDMILHAHWIQPS